MDLPNIDNKSVLIIGVPGSGKTHVANLLKDDNHAFIHTDNYRKYGFEKALDRCLLDIGICSMPTIVEGVLGYRLLRRGLLSKEYRPDIVIELKISEERLVNTYTYRREVAKLGHVRNLIKASETVLREYKAMDNEKPPEWIVIENNY